MHDHLAIICALMWALLMLLMQGDYGGDDLNLYDDVSSSRHEREEEQTDSKSYSRDDDRGSSHGGAGNFVEVWRVVWEL